MTRRECIVCGSGEDVLRHHVSYAPAETVPVCRACHARIHDDDDYMPGLTPDSIPEHRPFEHRRDESTISVGRETKERLSGYGETWAGVVRGILGRLKRR